MKKQDKNYIYKYLKKVDTTFICDADKNIKIMSSAIRCRSKNSFAFGYAYTVKCSRDTFALAQAIENASSGDVLVVDGEGAELAFAGEIFTRAAQGRKLAGLIIDGGCRDINYISSCTFPIFSKFITPLAAQTNKLGKVQIPIKCGGIDVLPGDFIITDNDGIIVLDPSQVISTLKKAIDIKKSETSALIKLNQGKSLKDCLNIYEHKKLLKQQKPSKLHYID